MTERNAETEADADDADRGAAEQLAQVYLVIQGDARLDVRRLHEGESVVVGRAEDADVQVDSTRVSRHHAKITLDNGAVTVADLGSRNGTRLAGETLRSASRVAKSGETIAVGPAEIVVARADGPASAASIPPRSPDGDDARVIVADPTMARLFAVIRRVARTPSTVLILGETGAGKEVCAEQIHKQSARSDRPFVRLNCASLPEALLESELFGYEKGAFTGALQARAGYFQAADGGTLLLDEIGEMALPVQAKLLRVLEQRAVTRLGGTREIAIDVRILCATHRDLASDVEAGRFRRDLFYRISTFTLDVPPLRERPTEITLLADAFARRYAHEIGAPAPVLLPETVATLVRHAWPGNVRELRNAMEHAVVLAEGRPIVPAHLPRALLASAPAPAVAALPDELGEIERRTIEAALAAEGGNQTRAAKRLGISRRALIYKIAKYGLR